MDSDVSVEGDGDSEQSPNRSSTSNQSGGSRSSSASPGRNSDERSSSDDEADEDAGERNGAKSPPAPPPKKRAAVAATRADSSSERESSPETKRHSDGASDDGGNSSPEARNGNVDRLETEPRKQSSPVDDSDGDTTPDVNDAEGGDEDNDDGDSSPDAARRAPISPAKSSSDADDDDDEVTKRSQSPDSSPDNQPVDDDSERERSPRPPNNVAAPHSPMAPVSPENGAWGSSESEMEKSAPNSPEAPASPDVSKPDAGESVVGEEMDHRFNDFDGSRFNDFDSSRHRYEEGSRHQYDELEDHQMEDRQLKKRATNRYPVDSDEGEHFGSVNGDAYPPKSPARRSTSVCSDRSNVGSSLDSVSPTQFEHIESNKMDDEFDDRVPKTVDIGRETDEADENKKGIIDFADDLSDVSDIESNDSFGDAEPAREEEKVIILYDSLFVWCSYRD